MRDQAKHLSRFAILVGFLFVEAATLPLTHEPFMPPDSPQQKAQKAQKAVPNLPVLAKQPIQSQFLPRFEQSEPMIAGDTFYYSSLPTTVTRAETRTFVVLFNFDSSRLSRKSKQILDNVVNIARNGRQIRIFATGHADTSGPDSYNQALSRQRVEAVHAAFIERGMTAEFIDKEAFGERRPRIATPDGSPDSRNRRVEIIVGPAPKI